MNKLNLPDLAESDALSFLFYQVPQALVDDEAFSGLDGWAILLYSLMLNRVGLSVKNSEHFKDEDGRLYIIFTVDEVMTRCRCGKNVAIKLIQQLEDIGLVEKKRQGLGRPSLIYVKNFAYYKTEHSQKFKKQTSGCL
jgi:predicted transcriptional regulator